MQVYSNYEGSLLGQHHPIDIGQNSYIKKLPLNYDFSKKSDLTLPNY